MGTPQKERTRKYRERRYAEIAEMEKIPCACGCGTLIAPINKKLQPATFAHGHLPEGVAHRIKPGDTSYWKGKKNPHLAALNKTRVRTPQEGAKRTAARYARFGPSYGAARGFKLAPEKIAQLVALSKARTGEKNHFYGKTHTPKARALMSDKLRGPKHPNWNGGTSTLPYGPEFTRKFKKIIRERDNYTCQRCGRTQEQEGRVLQIHHLDHDKTHNDPGNLVTACGSCNVWASYHRDEPFMP
jgi:hypothetical protein